MLKTVEPQITLVQASIAAIATALLEMIKRFLKLV
jgi:hypothetical protein